MSCDIVHAHEWDQPGEQFFTSVGFGRDIVVLYQDGGSGLAKVSSVDLPGSAICFDYSRTEHGLVLVGGADGSISTVNLAKPLFSSTRLAAKYPRPTNAVSVNSAGLAAMGLDRVRGEESLLIWDVAANSGTPIVSALPNEAVSSLRFIPQRPSQLLVGSYKSIREFDTRTNGSDARTIGTKYCFGIMAHQTDENIFLSLSESGTLALWDRRKILLATAAEPVLVIPRVFAETRSKLPRSVHFNPHNVGEFAVLNDGDIVRRWQTSISLLSERAQPVSALSSAVTSAIAGTGGSAPGTSDAPHDPEAWFVERVTDVATESDKVVAFDYSPSLKTGMDLVCIRQSGQVFRMRCSEPVRTLGFAPNNDFVYAESSSINTLEPKLVRAQHPHKRLETRIDSSDLLESTTTTDKGLYPESDSEQEDEQDDAASVASQEYQSVAETLRHDINHVMWQRAQKGYGSNCEQNIQILRELDPAIQPELLAAWKWLHNSKLVDAEGSLSISGIDLSFAGVIALWNGYPGFHGQRRYEDRITEKDYDTAVQQMVNRTKAKVYVSPSATNNSNKSMYRQLCLRATGWNFELESLEEKLQELEDKGMHEKAAGWAVFHGNVERAVQSLAASRRSHLRLMSTAVAGYLVYKDVEYNNPWREQCRRLASELSQPYLRAIFAYISDGSWADVLDEGSLPAVERLGIALRFLPDNELGAYLNRITERAIKTGDLEGIILLGLTPPIVDLLQSYVDKTADIQTASLIVTFGSTRFISESRIDGWVDAYAMLLNQWKMFTVRAIFDVSRNKLARSKLRGQQTSPIPKQLFLRCLNCREILGTRKSAKNAIRNDTRCPNCNSPLPKCAVCLLSLGPFSREEQPSMDKWPTFCMTCNHGFHTVHARQWFESYSVCPVPECHCQCGRQ